MSAACDLTPKFATARGRYAGRDLFITGESYSGVYVPLLADLVYEGEKAAKRASAASSVHRGQASLATATGSTGLKLRGVAVGDGVFRPTGPDGEWWFLQFMYGHQQVSTATYEAVLATCTEAALRDGTYASQPGCSDLLAAMAAGIGGYYEYNLYDTCDHSGDLQAAGGAGNGAGSGAGGLAGGLGGAKRRSEAAAARVAMRAASGALNDYPCGGQGAIQVIRHVRCARPVMALLTAF